MDDAAAGEGGAAKNRLFKRGSQNQISISNNSGGNVVEFALRIAATQQSGKQVRFTGRCDSACTMYLGLPRARTCVAPGAYFRFHMPQARSQRTTRLAQRFLYRKYPGWVRSWIAAKGGLSRQLITMDYSYARKFLRSC